MSVYYVWVSVCYIRVCLPEASELLFLVVFIRSSGKKGLLAFEPADKEKNKRRRRKRQREGEK